MAGLINLKKLKPKAELASRLNSASIPIRNKWCVRIQVKCTKKESNLEDMIFVNGK